MVLGGVHDQRGAQQLGGLPRTARDVVFAVVVVVVGVVWAHEEEGWGGGGEGGGGGDAACFINLFLGGSFPNLLALLWEGAG